VKETQQNDPFCVQIKSKFNNLRVQVKNDVLFKYFSDTTHIVPVIAASLTPENLKKFHDLIVGGNLRISKTYAKTKSRIYFPQLRKTITDYIRSCNTCQRVNYSNTKPAGLMSSPLVEAP